MILRALIFLKTTNSFEGGGGGCLLGTRAKENILNFQSVWGKLLSVHKS
jgi:hypothetical protein